MADFTTNIQEYLEAADKAHIAASLLPPAVFAAIPPSPLSSPHSAAPASVVPSHSPFVHPAAAVAVGQSPSWSSVGGYDHPQPGSRLIQYGNTLFYLLPIDPFILSPCSPFLCLKFSPSLPPFSLLLTHRHGLDA